MKPVETAAFAENVKTRYRKDIIMSTPITLLVLILPLVIMGAFLLFIRLGQLTRLEDFKSAWTMLLFTIQLFVMAIVMFIMYSRLHKHAKRDREWRGALLTFAKEQNVDTSRLEDLHKSISFRETFALSAIIGLLIVVLFVWDFVAFIRYIPEGYVNDVEVYMFKDSNIPLLKDITHNMVALIITLLVFLFIFYRVLTFPYKHEQNQCEYTAEFSMKLKKVGIDVPAMISFVKHRNIIIHLILMLLSFGLYTLWLARRILKSMNDHLINQWTYEEGLLPVLESGGREPFKNPEGLRTTNSRAVPKSVVREFTRYFVRKNSKKPKLLFLAELFLLVMCANYILKIVALVCEICNDYERYAYITFDNLLSAPVGVWMTLIMVGIYMILLYLCIDAMLGLASRRPSSWRKVTRSCITFVIPLWISELFIPATGISNMFSFNVYLSTAILYNVLLMMLVSYKIKRFYTPVGMAVPGMLTWVRFIFFGNLESGSDEIDDKQFLEAIEDNE
jgi:hypothetical protein